MLLFSSTFCHAQTDCIGDVPSISSITPSTWPAGQTTTVTINGANFCPDYGWVATTDDNGDYPITNITFTSGSQIALTVSPAAGDPAATITVTVGNCNDECGYSTSTTVQIVRTCTAPTISSITPLGWWAGQNNQAITINGSCFLTPSDKDGPSRVTATAEGVTLSDPSVVSSTQITATVKVTKKAPVETVTLTVTNPARSGVPGSVTASPAPVVLPIPVIKWKDKTISGDDAQNKNPSVIVGQPVELTTTPATLPGGFTVSKSTWDIDGTTIKKYDGGDSGITLEETDIDTQNTTFYWLYPDDPLNVTYEYCATDPNGNQFCTSPQAKATFNAKGPDSSNALSTWDSDEATIEHLTDCTTNTKSPYLGYGDLSGPTPDCPGPQSGTPGIELTASGASGGKYLFVQLIDSDSRTYTSSAGSYTCTRSPNLDKQYPYPPYQDKPNVAPDGPQMPLPSPDLSGKRDFLATMYLLWQPDKLSGATNPSIPVPIGHQQWQFKATTDQKQPIGKEKWEKPALIDHGDTGEYVPSQANDNELYGYPVFTAPATEVCP